jgi:hypothetical protein
MGRPENFYQNAQYHLLNRKAVLRWNADVGTSGMLSSALDGMPASV